MNIFQHFCKVFNRIFIDNNLSREKRRKITYSSRNALNSSLVLFTKRKTEENGKIISFQKHFNLFEFCFVR